MPTEIDVTPDWFPCSFEFHDDPVTGEIVIGDLEPPKVRDMMKEVEAFINAQECKAKVTACNAS